MLGRSGIAAGTVGGGGGFGAERDGRGGSVGGGDGEVESRSGIEIWSVEGLGGGERRRGTIYGGEGEGRGLGEGLAKAKAQPTPATTTTTTTTN